MGSHPHASRHNWRGLHGTTCFPIGRAEAAQSLAGKPYAAAHALFVDPERGLVLGYVVSEVS